MFKGKIFDVLETNEKEDDVVSTKPGAGVDHSDGHFFKTMEWSMVFEKKPL